MNLEQEVHQMMKEGVYDPHVIFKKLYERHPVHYSRVREAIHLAKQR